MLLGSGYCYIYMLRLVVRVLQYFKGIDDMVASCRLLDFGCGHRFWKDGRSPLFDQPFFFAVSSLSVVLEHTLRVCSGVGLSGLGVDKIRAPEPCLEQLQIFQNFQKLGWRGEGEIPYIKYVAFPVSNHLNLSLNEIFWNYHPKKWYFI